MGDNRRPGSVAAARALGGAIEQLTLNLKHAGHYPQYAEAVSEIAEQAGSLLRSRVPDGGVEPPNKRPSPADLQVKRAEIAHRYERKLLVGRLAEGEAKYQRGLRDRQHLRLAELRRLLVFWTAAEKDTAELADIIAAGGAMDFNGRELGLVLDFRMADYKMFGAAGSRYPSTIRPNDRSQADVDAYLRDVRKPQQREARKLRYAERRATEATRKAAAADLSCRKSAVDKALDVTIGGKRLSVNELAAALEGSVAFMKPGGKRPLKGASLHKAIRRVLKTLEDKRKVEITTTPAKRGPDMWLARKLPG
jgi:hypothetical protein